MKAGDRIRVNDTWFKGTVTEVTADGYVQAKLDNGMEMSAPIDSVTLLDESGAGQRDEKGRFLPGHKKLVVKKRGNSIRQIRKELLEQLQPFISDVGNIIELIDEPQEKILAVTRMMKFCVPTYSAVEYTENTPRSLSAEESLAKLNAKYNNKPDPIKDDEEDEN